MATNRITIPDFQLANPAHANAVVTFYAVDGAGARADTLVTLYDGSTGTGTLANPHTLDSSGKFRVPVYIEAPTIARIGSTSLGSYETGIIGTTGVQSANAAAVSAAAASASANAAANSERGAVNSAATASGHATAAGRSASAASTYAAAASNSARAAAASAASITLPDAPVDGQVPQWDDATGAYVGLPVGNGPHALGQRDATGVLPRATLAVLALDADAEAAAGMRYICDTRGGTFTLTLPAAPADGDVLEVLDAHDSFATHPLILARNGHTIVGTAEDLVCDLARAAFALVHAGGDWRLV
ncbi:hypothetical protein F1188_11035 [Roseospira marina]|uniref:Uncharacterized protein n=1 Tax=Roseospira marina TaxID=140057 RepID=A0A5M6ICS9_9PROT|nr:hypothetical protein [Roseospira marina]KAA5605428.1 hypothetical protein F1188_11035 [Roseospira marina]MBB4314577.1 hypothetical protein [Roseospira marina]MBB5088861.1 hypothetical protein [Roseospira marina]